MKPPLRLLIIGPSREEATLLSRLLEDAGYEVVHRRVETSTGLKAALAEAVWDVVVSDYKMPEFDGMAALEMVQSCASDLPFILAASAVPVDEAVAAMKAGVRDLIPKGQLARLSHAVQREVREAQARAKRRQGEEDVRRSAEKKLNQSRRTTAAGDRRPKSDADTRRILHELQVHQIELEMQNEECLRTRHEAETALARYTDLYDFAPVGYLTLGLNGTIQQSNLTCAALLGIERSRLLNRRLDLNVSVADRAAFNAFLGKVLDGQSPHSCELTLLRENKQTFWAQIEAKKSDDTPECRLIVRDVTERKQAEAALAANLEAIEHERNLLQAVMDGATNSHLAYLDRDFNFLRVNAAYARTCGRRPEELIGQNHFVLYPDAENEVIFARVRDTGELAEYHDKPFVFPDRPERGITYWDWTLTPVKDVAHRVQGLILSLFETTTPKRAEVALRQSHDRRLRVLETALRSAANAIAITGADGAIQWVNPAFTKLTGYTADEAIEQNLRVLKSGQHPREFYQAMWQTIRAGRVWRGELVNKRKDGSLYTEDMTIAPVTDAAGAITHYIAIKQDNTERETLVRELAAARDALEERVQERTADLQRTVALLQVSERRYRALFEGAPLGIALHSANGRFQEVNQAFVETVGYTAAELLERGVKNITHPDDIAEGKKLFEELRAGTRDSYRREKRYQHKNGHLVWAKSAAFAVRNDSGELKYIVSMIEDITSDKQDEKRAQGIAAVLELFATKSTRIEYLDAAVKLLRDWCECDAVGVHLSNATGWLAYASSVGFSRQIIKRERATDMSLGECLCTQVLRGLELTMDPPARPAVNGFVCHHVKELLQRNSAVAEIAGAMPCVEAGFESIAHMPIRFQDRILGSIHLADHRPGRFPPETIAFIDSMASIMGEALHRFVVEESLHESEERFRSLFEKHAAVMLLLDPASGAIVDSNPAAAAFYGCTREQLRILNLRELGFTPPKATQPDQPQGWPRSRETFETPTRLPTGETRTVEIHSSPISVRRRSLAFAIIHDVTERKSLERQILEIGEKERQRIGFDLHDSLGGHLTGVALMTKALAQLLEQQGLPQAELAGEISGALSEAVARTRAIAHGLCPIEPGAQGLISGLHEFLEGVRRRTGLACRFHVEGRISIVDAMVASHLFRIVEEAVQNALHHAGPKSIEIRLRRVRSGHLLTIWNDGRPLPTQLDTTRGLGLRTMRYRANMIGGELALLRESDGGTVVSCLVPDRDPPLGPSPKPSVSRRPAGARLAPGKTRSRRGKKS